MVPCRNEKKLVASLFSTCRGVCTIVGGVLFHNMTSGHYTLPMNVKYTIRVVSNGEIGQTASMFADRLSTAPRRTKQGSFPFILRVASIFREVHNFKMPSTATSLWRFLSDSKVLQNAETILAVVNAVVNMLLHVPV